MIPNKLNSRVYSLNVKLLGRVLYIHCEILSVYSLGEKYNVYQLAQ